MHLNAKLVTLSACNTGVGPVGEAGVANLVNAFIEAGAESVVSTLWELEDHSTSRLMTDFYRPRRNARTGSRKHSETRSFELIKEQDPPYFWASFQLVGNPDTSLVTHPLRGIEMTLTRSDRQNLLGKITTLVAEKYYDPAFGGKDWKQIVSKHTDSIVSGRNGGRLRGGRDRHAS